MKLQYKYLIYKVYSWTVNKKNDTPIANTIFVLGIAHLFQMLTLFLVIDRLVVPLEWAWNLNKFYLLIGLIFYFILFYFLIYNKNRWKSFVEEFKNESEEQRKRGNILVISYLIGSFLLFFVSLPILFTLGRN